MLLNRTQLPIVCSLIVGLHAFIVGCSREPVDDLPRLQAELKSPVMEDRYGAVKELGFMTDRSAEVVPMLIAALKDRDPVVRESAAYQLGGFAEAAAPAVPPLGQSLLKDRDADVRTAAAYALSELGQVAAPAATALRAATRDRNPETRQEASQALERIQVAVKFHSAVPAAAAPEEQRP